MSHSVTDAIPNPPQTPESRPDGRANPVRDLQRFGQSVWLDYLRRSLFTSGEFKRLIEEDGLRGATSNPSIFEKAVAGSTDYAGQLQDIERGRDADPMALYEAVAIGDIRDAADLLRPVYDATRREDGYVSLEVSPYLAHDTNATILEARRLWKAVDRPNVMIKVPASREGLPAIRQLTSEGLNVNITLLFGIERYADVARAYMDGLSSFVQAGGDPGQVSSVASFFVSRVDTMVDGLITARLSKIADAPARAELEGLLGKAAIANAKLAYQEYLRFCDTDAWQRLAASGAHRQRLLWASTSTKNPRYRDVRYVEELIGADTVNTITPATLEAFRDHGLARNSLEEQIEDARATIEALGRAGISLTDVTERLLEDGIGQFCAAFDRLMVAVGRARRSEITSLLDRQRHTLPAEVLPKVAACIGDWQSSGKVRRLWAGDPTLWTGRDENHWVGWLGATDDQLAHIAPLKAISTEVANAGVLHLVLLGMGGSSLGADVIRATFGRIAGFPELHVLDSTVPAQIAALEGRLDLSRTLFIVSSKSGTTLEPNLLMSYFLDRMRRLVGEHRAGGHFLAITDPGSALQLIAEREQFRQVFWGVPTIGGRYSVLSSFGLVPAALTGVDIGRLLDRTELMVHSCAASVPAEENPAVVLGCILGTLALAGRDKVTFIISPSISSLGAWLEQLLAESTGKQGRGLIPVDGERPGSPEVYGEDRLFIYTRLDSDPDPSQDAAVNALERAGRPVVRISVPEIYDIGQEFFRWEMAVAVAGSILNIDPFDQPDVEAAKIATRTLTNAFEKTGMWPSDPPILTESGVTLLTDASNAAALEAGLRGDRSLAGYLRAHLDRLEPGDYFALLAYVGMNPVHTHLLQEMRHAVRDRTRNATCLGFGPRFLHSTGQAYKGGPNSGVFLQVTGDADDDIAVPGRAYSFGGVTTAEAHGDFAVLTQRGRRALRVHLGTKVDEGLATLCRVLRQM